MSAEERNLFFDIVGPEFTSDELERLAKEAGMNSYYTEPVDPTREQLLEFFHAMLEEYATDEFTHLWSLLHARMGDLIIPQLSVGFGEKLMVDHAEVFVVGSGAGLVCTDGKVFGDFAGFVPEDSFYVDCYSDDEPRLAATGDLGLYVVLCGASIELVDGTREPLGNTLVSLSNGTPQLNRVVTFD